MKLQDELREEVRSHAQFSSAIFDTREDARWKAAAQLDLYEAALREGDALLTELLDGPSGGDFYGVGSGTVLRGKLLTVRDAIRPSTDTGA